MLVPQDEGYDMQLIGIAIRWKTAFHPEGTLLFQSDVLPFLPSLPPLALSCDAARSISKYLAHVPGGGWNLATCTREPRFAHRHVSIILYPPECLEWVFSEVPKRSVSMLGHFLSEAQDERPIAPLQLFL